MTYFIVINNLKIDKEIHQTINSIIENNFTQIDYNIDLNIENKNKKLDDLINFITENKIKIGVIAIKNLMIRKIISQYISNFIVDFNFLKIVHPSSIIGRKTRIGIGSIIMANTIINTYSTIKDFCIIESNTTIDHDSTINNYSNIGTGVTTGGNFKLGSQSVIGIGVCIIENINIGKCCHVEKGSLVTKDIGPNTKVEGIPAKKIS